MGENDTLDRSHLPIPDPQWVGVTTYDAKDPDTGLPADHTRAPARWGTQRPHRPHRRRRLRVVERVRRPVQHADLRAPGRRGPEVHPLPHDRAVLADAGGAAERPQPSHASAWAASPRSPPRRPGYSSLRPKNKAPLGRDAQAQRLLHRPVRQVPRGAGLGDQPDGPVRPLAEPGNGFEHFYGFIGGETNQYAPAIYRDTVPVEPDRTAEEGYHFTEDMTDHAIEWVRQQKALMPDKPFFVYYAPGATHAPHHVPTEWSDKYKGAFDDGWDALRERTFARQKELGVIPQDAELTARPPRSRPGTRCPTTSSRCWPARWRSTPGSWSTPTTIVGRLRRRPRRAGDPRRHAGLLHHRRQRRVGRGHAAG